MVTMCSCYSKVQDLMTGTHGHSTPVLAQIHEAGVTKSHVNNQGPDQSSLVSGLSQTLHSLKTIMHRLPCVHKE